MCTFQVMDDLIVKTILTRRNLILQFIHRHFTRLLDIWIIVVPQFLFPKRIEEHKNILYCITFSANKDEQLCRGRKNDDIITISPNVQLLSSIS